MRKDAKEAHAIFGPEVASERYLDTRGQAANEKVSGNSFAFGAEKLELASHGLFARQLISKASLTQLQHSGHHLLELLVFRDVLWATALGHPSCNQAIELVFT